MSVRTNEASRAAGEVRPVEAGRGGGRSSVSGHLVWPASGDRSEGTPTLVWFSHVRHRLEELLDCAEGWDGYLAAPLAPSAVDHLLPLLSRYGQFVQSAPSVALSVEGGLVCRWDQSEYVTQLESFPNGAIVAYFADPNGEEHEVDALTATELNKWLWQSSAPAFH